MMKEKPPRYLCPHHQQRIASVRICTAFPHSKKYANSSIRVYFLIVVSFCIFLISSSKSAAYHSPCLWDHGSWACCPKVGLLHVRDAARGPHPAVILLFVAVLCRPMISSTPEEDWEDGGTSLEKKKRDPKWLGVLSSGSLGAITTPKADPRKENRNNDRFLLWNKRSPLLHSFLILSNDLTHICTDVNSEFLFSGWMPRILLIKIAQEADKRLYIDQSLVLIGYHFIVSIW